MAPVRIPEGQVFVQRAPGVAAALLDAAEELGYVRSEAVRTVSGGYHVPEDVAAAYQATLPEEAESETPAATSAEAGGAQTPPATDPKEDDPHTATPREGWSHDQFDTWAENQEPKVVFPKGANLAVKLEVATAPPAPAGDDSNPPAGD
jgi:hypothetical protein